MLEYFPAEILEDIFQRLPSKSVCRFLCISKSWYARFTHKSFISRNLNHQSNNSHLLFQVYKYEQHIDDFAFYPYHQILTANVVPSLVLNPPHDPPLGRGFTIVGYCHGLICSSQDNADADVVLWNPSIRKCFTLPKPDIETNHRGMRVFGFGNDVDDDIKVVRIVYQVDNTRSMNQDQVPPRVHVYSLGTGLWRRIEDVALKHTLDPHCQQFLNGRAHWVASRHGHGYGYAPGRFLIVSFDMTDHLFRDIELPTDLDVSVANIFVLTVYKDCLAVLGTKPFRPCLLQVMTEFGNASSWATLYRVDVEHPNPLVGFTYNGDILIKTQHDDLALLNPNNGSMVNLWIFGSGEAMYATKYVESLILIDA